jgi:hypothetical protein
MAPEQLADSKSVDARADVFGVGATLYVLMCKASVRDLFRVADDPARMEGVPPPLVTVLTRCLEYERDDRYADADALIAALNAALEVLPQDPPDTPPLPRSERPGPPGAQDTWFSEIIPLMGDFEPSTEVPVQTSELPAPTPAPPPYVERPQQLYVEEPVPVPVLRDDITAPVGAAPPPDPPRHGTTLFLALVTAGLVGGAAALGVLATLGWGAQHVNGAHEDYLTARRALVDGVEQARPMVDELASAGVPTRRVTRALGGLDAAPPDERVEASLAFIDAARVAAADIPPRDRHATQVVHQRLERLEVARAQVQRTWVVWTEHAAHPAGQIAIAIGLADAP